MAGLDYLDSHFTFQRTLMNIYYSTKDFYLSFSENYITRCIISKKLRMIISSRAFSYQIDAKRGFSFQNSIYIRQVDREEAVYSVAQGSDSGI